MKRLTERKENGVINVRYATEHETAIHRLAAIEDILGDEYDLDRFRELVKAYREERYIVLKEPRQAGVHRLSELAQADREGRCVVFASGYPVGSIYYKDVDGKYIREASGVVTTEEYEAALRREQDGNRI